MEPTESPTLPSRPPVAWIRFDQRLIQAMLDFANMEGTPAEAVEPLFWPFQMNLWVRVRPEKKEQLLGTVRYRPGSWNQALSERVMGPYADDLLASVGLDRELAVILAHRGVTTCEQVADLSVGELLAIIDIGEERAGALIMKAREPLFEKGASGDDPYRGWQKRLSAALTDIVNDGHVDPSFQSFLEQTLTGMPFRLEFVEGVPVYKFSIESVRAGWSLGLVMLLDSDYLLRRCSECEKFFAIFDPKKRSRLYCLDCADDVEREKRNERQLRYRRKKRGKK